MSNLRKASDSFEDLTSVIDEGIEAINIHLQLLWWEFPKEHWQPLRDDSRMNFLQEPEPMIHDNAAMDTEQTRVAAEFVEELLDLGVVQTPREGRIVLATAPHFVAPKEAARTNAWLGIQSSSEPRPRLVGSFLDLWD
jgi:hypothetical protein